MSKIDQIKRLMAGLPHDALREVRNYATMRLGSGVPAKTNRDDDIAELVLDCICDVARSKGIDMTTPPALKKSAQYAAFAHKLEERHVGSFLRDASKRSRVVMRGFVYFAIELIIENLQEMNVPISARTVMSHIHRLPAVIDQAFPGYAESGLLGLIIREQEVKHVRSQRGNKTVQRPNGKATRQ